MSQESQSPAIRRALISVSDKSGITEFAQALADRGVELLSTGGTAKLIADAGIAVTEVSQHTGAPEIMDGRVKTLHPKIHGGLLGRDGTDDAVMVEQGIAPIDLLVVNLYPFRETIAKPDCQFADAIENIDIGGPTMLRAAAKNHARVTVLVDPADYATVLAEMAENAGRVTDATRLRLARQTYEHTAAYDGAIANYLGALDEERQPTRLFPATFNLQVQRRDAMRYGENPHQNAAFYTDADIPNGSIAAAEQLQGKTLSYNNIADADAALEAVKNFPEPACVIVKHANPCGVAIAEDCRQAYQQAFKTDPTSAFGGIIALNRPLDAETAKTIIDNQFVEVIIAPSVDAAALEITAAKQNVRVMACGQWEDNINGFDLKRVGGGLLIQDRDNGNIELADLKIVSKIQPSDNDLSDLLFAWRVAKFVKSNAIVYAKNSMTIGVGAGQMSRIDSARIAAIKAQHAGLEVSGSVMASDAFFPFRDGIDAAAEVGIKAVIQPGGSMRDDEVIAAADEHGMAMVFTGMRHFRH